MLRRIVLTAVLVIVAVVAIAIYAHHVIPKNAASTIPTHTVNPAEQPIVRYNGSAFAPTAYTMKEGASIIFLNTSKLPLTVVSDPNSSKTDHPEFNLSIAPGTSKGLTVTKPGTWGYSNQSNPSATGQLIVQ